jgi:hypothetical protein
MFLIDARGTLVFFNEAAEFLLGKTYAEVGPLDALDFGAMLKMAELDGTPLRRRDSPAGVAFFEREPAHRTLLATAFDGTRRKYEVTAHPLFGQMGEMHGVLAIFWQAKE